jgi:antitoxin PrlF
MTIGTMTSKGQLTIPVHLREKFRMNAGTKVSFEELPDGRIAIRPKTGDIRALRGIVKYNGPPVSIEDINETISKAATRRFKQSEG